MAEGMPNDWLNISEAQPRQYTYDNVSLQAHNWPVVRTTSLDDASCLSFKLHVRQGVVLRIYLYHEDVSSPTFTHLLLPRQSHI